jgi:hypothetical protein
MTRIGQRKPRRPLHPLGTLVAAGSGILLLLASMILTACRAEEASVTAVDAIATNRTTPADEAYADLLTKHASPKGMVDYKALKANRQELDHYVRSLAGLDPKAYEEWSDEEKIAFWINAYNGLTLKVIIDHYPIKTGGLIASLRFPEASIRQIPGVWDRIRHVVMGQPMTLDEIEHEVLRKRFDEPRIHMALVCAAMGCPPLRNEPYAGGRLDAQLNDQTRMFLSDPDKFRIDRRANRVYLSSIFKWFDEDFARKYATSEFQQVSAGLRPVLNFISRHVDPEDARYLKDQSYSVNYLDYDWSLNEEGKHG